MRLKILSCLAALALAPAVGASSAAASPLAQGAAAKAAIPAGVQLAQTGDGVYTGGKSRGGGGGDGVYRGGGRSGGGDGVYRGGGRSAGGGDGVYRGGARSGGGDGVYRGGGAFRDRGAVRSFDGDRRFSNRHRRVVRDGIYVYPYTSYAYTPQCHRHYRGVRVLRHCHPYSYRAHVHGRWH